MWHRHELLCESLAKAAKLPRVMFRNRYSSPQAHCWVCLQKDASAGLTLFQLYCLFEPGAPCLDGGLILPSVWNPEGIGQEWTSDSYVQLKDHWDPWFDDSLEGNHGPPIIVYLIFTYRLDLEIFKGELKVFYNKYDENMIKIKISEIWQNLCHLSMKNMKNHSCLYTFSQMYSEQINMDFLLIL